MERQIIAEKKRLQKRCQLLKPLTISCTFLVEDRNVVPASKTDTAISESRHGPKSFHFCLFHVISQVSYCLEQG